MVVTFHWNTTREIFEKKKIKNLSTPSKEIKFSKDEMEKIVSYIPYREQTETNMSDSNAEIWHVGSETFNYQINLSDEMKQYKGIPENVKLEGALKRFLDQLIEEAKSNINIKSAYIRLFFNKFPASQFTTTTILKEDILNDHLQSNASELLEGDWTGTMVASRVMPQPSNRN